MTEAAAPFIMIWRWPTRLLVTKNPRCTNFMGVYGSNIDFRDVVSRIKALKS